MRFYEYTIIWERISYEISCLNIILILAGNPAVSIKENINWLYERIK